MAYYLHYQHPTVTRGLVAGGFTCADEAEGRRYLADYAAQGYRAELWLGDKLIATAWLMKPAPDPVRQLLIAYQEADIQAALHFQALRFTNSPRCLCRCGAAAKFRRFFFRLA